MKASVLFFVVLSSYLEVSQCLIIKSTPSAVVNSEVSEIGDPGQVIIATVSSFTQTSSGTLLVDVGAGGNDMIQVTGSASLSGIVQLNYKSGSLPTEGQTLIVIQLTGTSGGTMNGTVSVQIGALSDSCIQAAGVPAVTTQLVITMTLLSGPCTDSTKTIIYAVVGGFIGLIVLLGVIVCVRMSYKKKKTEAHITRTITVGTRSQALDESSKPRAHTTAPQANGGYSNQHVSSGSNDIAMKSISSNPLPRAWAAGDQCLAIWSEDKQWYRAQLIEFDPARNAWLVMFSDYGNQDWCDAKNIVPTSATKNAE
jgi:hypothetical protein